MPSKIWLAGSFSLMREYIHTCMCTYINKAVRTERGNGGRAVCFTHLKRLGQRVRQSVSQVLTAETQKSHNYTHAKGAPINNKTVPCLYIPLTKLFIYNAAYVLLELGFFSCSFRPPLNHDFFPPIQQAPTKERQKAHTFILDYAIKKKWVFLSFAHSLLEPSPSLYFSSQQLLDCADF